MTPCPSTRPASLRPHLLWLSLLVFTFLLPARSLASVVYVDTDAAGPIHDGASWATAFPTLQAGVNAAHSGDEVWVAAGIYPESVTLSTGVSLAGGFAGTETDRGQRDWRRNVTVLDGSGLSNVQGVIVASVAGASVDGLTVRKGLTGIYSFSGSLTMSNCSLVANEYAVSVSMGTVSARNCTVRGSRFGFQVSGDATIRDCVVSGGIDGLALSFGTATVANCTITGNTGKALSVNGVAASLTNNIFAFNGAGLERADTSTASVLTLSHNDVFGNTVSYINVADPTGSDGNFSLDPKVVNRYRDPHIQPDSPCVDAGDDTAVVSGETDIDGQARIQRAHVDIGADESDGTVWPVATRIGYVSTAGSDANDGTAWSRAKRTIDAALNAEPGFDEVWVARGTYPESLYIPAGVALYGGFFGIETDRGQRHGPDNATSLDGSGNTRGTLVQLRFPDSRLDGFTLRNAWTGIYAGGGATIANCAVHGITGRAIFVTSGTATITNGTISGNAGYGLWSDLTGGADVSNTIIAHNVTGIQQGKAGMVTLSHCDVFGNTVADFQGMPDPTGSNGNISADPKLANPYLGSHIEPDSPCVDAGDDSAVAPGAADIDGQPRIQGTHVDIGADESDGTVWPVPSRILYVSKTGDDANDGSSWATAKKNLGAVLAQAQPLDEVWIGRGLYNEAITVPAGVALYGGFVATETEKGQRDLKVNPTAVDGGGAQSVVTVSGRGAVLDGLGIRNGGRGVFLPNGSVVVAHCSFTATASGVYQDPGTAATVTDSIVSGSAAAFDSRGALTVTNCTVAGGAGSGFLVSGGTVRITNSIVAYNGVYGIKLAGSPQQTVLLLSHNDFFQNALGNYWLVADPTGKDGNISVDPKFLSRVAGDYHLLTGSPCIDAGDDAYLVPGEVDRDGRPRRIGAHVDMGAFEFGATFFTVADAALALRIAGGLEEASDVARLNVETTGAGLDVMDAVSILRKATGLEANP